MGDFPLSRPSQKSYGVHSRDLGSFFCGEERVGQSFVER